MTKVWGRRNLAVVAAALMAFGGFASWGSPAPAQAMSVQPRMNMTCPPGGLFGTSLAVDFLVSEARAPRPSGLLNFKVQPVVRLPAGSPPVVVTSVHMVLPDPTATLAVFAILSASSDWEVWFNKASPNIHVGLTPLGLDHPAGLGALGTLRHVSVVKAGATYVEVPGPSEMVFNVQLLGYPVSIRCTAAAGNPPILRVNTVA